MKKHMRFAVAGFSALIAIAGLKLSANSLPVALDGSEWRSIEECAENQKRLYQSTVWEVRENGGTLARDFKVKGFPAREIWKCPACGEGYELHPENFGNPNAVLISDEREGHPTTFMWWAKGLKPQVQTMGDGTIQLFEDGELLTMNGSR